MHVVAAGHHIVRIGRSFRGRESKAGSDTVSTFLGLLLSAERSMHTGPLAAPVTALDALPLCGAFGGRTWTARAADPAVTTDA